MEAEGTPVVFNTSSAAASTLARSSSGRVFTVCECRDETCTADKTKASRKLRKNILIFKKLRQDTAMSLVHSLAAGNESSDGPIMFCYSLRSCCDTKIVSELDRNDGN